MSLALIPAPVSVTPLTESYELAPTSRIVAPAASPATAMLARVLGLPVVTPGGDGDVRLIPDGPADLGEEGYLLDIDGTGVTLRAATGLGLYRAAQTLRQLLPAPAAGPGAGAVLPGVRLVDRPRFSWRGVHLDVARHFFGVGDVCRFIDLVEPYKLNVLHLHLTDDQGWRLAIPARPRLAEVGGANEVGGGPGGYYDADDYRAIVRYAAERGLTVVPEIDMPGHTHAALVAYPELAGEGAAPQPYTGTRVGFSTLRAEEETYRFVDDVVREVAALTPGPYLHIGGDEAKVTTRSDYVAFVTRVEEIVRSYGKTMVGWQEIAAAPVSAETLVQYWEPDRGSEPRTWAARETVARGGRLIMSPASHTYLDLKPEAGCRLGLEWAGLVTARSCYEWDPASYVDGVGEPDVVGVEAALWTETLQTFDDLSYMLLPRLPGIAEVAWSPRRERSWEGYVPRLAEHIARWEASGVIHGP
jgi:hexosaminidase